MVQDIRFYLKPKYLNSYALLVGINKYKKAPPLSYAVNDAEEIRDVLVSDLSFPQENITCLLDKEATKENILKSFLKYTADTINLDDRILIFFAGHGNTIRGNRGEVGFLVPYNADMADCSTLIRWDELTRNAELIKAKHMFFIMDACYGGLALSRNAQAGSTRFLRDMLLRFSRQVLTAGKADETVSDSGGPLADHSIFTGHLIEGLRGGATTESGVLTANTLMSYVYGKVSQDKSSQQTPHYGHFDGDGDFILKSPLQQKEPEDNAKEGEDQLIAIPYPEEIPSEENTQTKIKKVKLLLADDKLSIELHDYTIEEVRRFLSNTSEDHFKSNYNYSHQEFVERISKYEDVTNDLCMSLACLAYWAKPVHFPVIQKIITKSTDRLESQNGLTVWNNLRWFPVILELYCSGIAAVEAKRYDSLFHILHSSVAIPEDSQDIRVVAESVGNVIYDISKLFNNLPEHEKYRTPMSEYLFKVLQPKLDEYFFIGKSYERVFDEFETLFALTIADFNKRKGKRSWGPLGRFAWKQERLHERAPLSLMIKEAQLKQEKWQPIQNGFFSGDINRFFAVANEYQKSLSELGWW